MRIKDLSEGFADGFKKGYGSPLLGKSTPEKKAAPEQRAANPFSILDPSDAKDILRTILNKQTLDDRQLRLLQRVYNKF